MLEEDVKQMFSNKLNRLETWFPPGLFEEHSTPEAKKALDAIRLIEELIKEDSYMNFLLYRKILLQEFRHSKIVNIIDGYDLNKNDSINQYLLSLFPDQFHNLISSFNEHESEIFLKFFLLSHEIVGKIEGTKVIIQAMLESVVQKSINIRIILPEKQDREIAGSIRSLLGSRFSVLGNDFVPGYRYYARPLFYEIHIGPIDIKTLSKFQENNWADDRSPSERLKLLAGLTEPYYIFSKIKFIIATLGFTIGKSKIGHARLGNTEIF